MRPYEVMVIFDAGAEPPAVQAVVDRMLASIGANDGAPGHIDRWGRRPFAYEVKHRREGYYVVVEFGGTSQTVAELDRLLSLADEVLRHKVIRLPDKLTRRPAAASGAPGRGRGPARAGAGPRASRAEAATAAPADEPGQDDAAASAPAGPADRSEASSAPAAG